MLRILSSALCVAAMLAVAPVAAPSVAEARINIDIGISLNRGQGITCGQGERILRKRGFRDITRVDCRGRYFVYRGTRDRNRYEISVRARDGRVVDVRWLRRV